MKLVIQPEVEADLELALVWYDVNVSPQAGDELLAEFERELDWICQMPEVHAIRKNGLRRVNMRRYPYGIYYRCDRQTIHVVAVMHHARDPHLLDDR
jgi:toxin ParE1/3/4